MRGRQTSCWAALWCAVAVCGGALGCGSTAVEATSSGDGGGGGAAPTPCAGAVGLPGVPQVQVSVYPQAIAAVDFDGDGKLDLVAVGGSNPSMEVLLNQGKGAFAAGESYEAGLDPRAVTAADLDGDGKPDLAVADFDKGVSVLLNHVGAAPVPYPAGAGATSVVAADFDGDGKLDLATANLLGKDVTVLLNQGKGTFAAPIHLAPGFDFTNFALAAHLVAADFDGDGRPDLAVASDGSSEVGVLLNQGKGTFAAPATYAVGKASSSIVTADFDGDGEIDIAVTNAQSDTVSVLRNQGKGTFGAPVDHAAGRAPTSAAAADLDGDGTPDLAVMDDGTLGMRVMLNQGKGAFPSLPAYAVGSGAASVIAADLDGDGRVDIAASNRGAHTVSVVLNQGKGTFAAPAIQPVSDTALVVAVADFDGDGVTDVAVAMDGKQDKGVELLPGRPDGTFAPAPELGPGTGARSLTVADLDGDGRLDLAATTSDGNGVTVYLNKGHDNFKAITSSGGKGAESIAVADLDGDGKPDVVVANRSNDLSVMLNQGKGQLGPATSRPSGFVYSDSTPAPQVVAADLNGDGRPDLAVVADGKDGTGLAVLLNEGGGAFAPALTYAVGPNPTSLVAADLDGDGRLDLAASVRGPTQGPDGPTEVSGWIGVLLNQGDGHFAPTLKHFGGISPRSVVAVDLNGDGRLDLAAANADSADVTVLVNQGSGNFAEPLSYPDGSLATGMAAGDLDGDGRPDLVISHVDGQVSILRDVCLP